MSELDVLLAKANKKYGEGTVIKGSALKGLSIERVTTGSLAYDIMLGGGWPLNQWNEVIGNPSNGKTVMALKTIAANQALNPDYETLWIAAEDFVPDWAEKCGVDVDRVTVVQTNVMEHAYQIVVDALDARAMDAVIIDSLPALVPDSEAERAMEDLTPGLGARLTGKMLRKSTKAQKRSLTEEDRPCLGIIINQWRSKIGVMFGDPRTTPGGQAKDYHYFTRVEVSRDEWIEENKIRMGLSIKAKTLKNKTAPAYRVAAVDFYFSDVDGHPAGNYDSVKEIFYVSMMYDVLAQGGGYYSFRGERINDEKGKENALAVIRYDLDLQKSLKEEVFNLALPHLKDVK
jgi:recombination protein RecA